MNEFEAYIAQLVNNNALGKEASAPAASVDTSTAHSQTKAASNEQQPTTSQSKIASIVSDTIDTLPEDLKEQADALAFMEAFATAKQANYIKEEVQGANMYNQQQITAADAAEANALYAAAYKQASMEIQQVNQNYGMNKTASEAQSFIDGIYADVFKNVLAEEANTWNYIAHQNAGLVR